MGRELEMVQEPDFKARVRNDQLRRILSGRTFDFSNSVLLFPSSEINMTGFRFRLASPLDLSLTRLFIGNSPPKSMGSLQNGPGDIPS